MQYLGNFKLSPRDREEYVGHENLQAVTVAANPKSKKLLASRLQFRTDQPTSLVFSSFLVEFHRHRASEVLNEEEYSILRILDCSVQPPTTLIPCILQWFWHTLSHMFFSEAKHCYSRNDVRANSSHSPLFLVGKMERSKFTIIFFRIWRSEEKGNLD